MIRDDRDTLPPMRPGPATADHGIDYAGASDRNRHAGSDTPGRQGGHSPVMRRQLRRIGSASRARPHASRFLLNPYFTRFEQSRPARNRRRRKGLDLRSAAAWSAVLKFLSRVAKQGNSSKSLKGGIAGLSRERLVYNCRKGRHGVRCQLTVGGAYTAGIHNESGAFRRPDLGVRIRGNSSCTWPAGGTESAALPARLDAGADA